MKECLLIKVIPVTSKKKGAFSGALYRILKILFISCSHINEADLLNLVSLSSLTE